MRKLFIILFATGMTSIVMASSPQLTYNGELLPWNTEFTRTLLNYVNKNAVVTEISGIACSRVTPGYIWMESDEDRTCVVATDDAGQTRYKKVTFSSSIDRNDWEDMCGGKFNGKDYLFVGCFGDNNASKGNYQILYFEEPAITGSSTVTVAPNIIKFQYPNGTLHNAEAMMYDNREQMIYIVTKVYYDVCQVYKLPMSLNYGSNLQTLTYVCDLGVKSDIGIGATGDGDKAYKGFHLVTGADISPDGNYVLIKNHNNTAGDLGQEYSWTLMWKRQGNESLSETLKRQPEPIGCYEQEWQGEAICWLDSTTFYTVSDDEGQPPMYKYVRTMGGGGTPDPDPDPDPAIEKDITIDGNFDDWSDLNGLAHAEVPSSTTHENLYDMRWYADEAYIYFYLEFSTDVEPIDIFLSTDDNASTGHNGWMFQNSAAEYLIEEEDIANHFTDVTSTFFTFDGTKAQSAWDGWIEANISGTTNACAPVTLANGHRAIEGRIVQALFPDPVVALKVGVFTSDASWVENGYLPQGDGGDAAPLLEVPIYKVPTGIDAAENQESSVESRKMIRNGQLFIIRDGKTYNAQGIEVR